jgi:hypothetical protein
MQHEVVQKVRQDDEPTDWYLPVPTSIGVEGSGYGCGPSSVVASGSGPIWTGSMVDHTELDKNDRTSTKYCTEII